MRWQGELLDGSSVAFRSTMISYRVDERVENHRYDRNIVLSTSRYFRCQHLHLVAQCSAVRPYVRVRCVVLVLLNPTGPIRRTRRRMYSDSMVSDLRLASWTPRAASIGMVGFAHRPEDRGEKDEVASTPGGRLVQTPCPEISSAKAGEILAPYSMVMCEESDFMGVVPTKLGQ